MVVKAFFIYIFVQPLELKLKVCTYFTSDLMAHRDKIRMPSTKDFFVNKELLLCRLHEYKKHHTCHNR